MKRARVLKVVFLVLGLAAVIALWPVPICRVVVEADRHTGSRRGYTRFAWGARVGEWHRPSVIETFMRNSHAAEFQQAWVSSQGNEYNIFGFLLARVHGSPGPILSLDPALIDERCRESTDAEKHRIYKVLAGGDKEKINQLIEAIRFGPTRGS